MRQINATYHVNTGHLLDTKLLMDQIQVSYIIEIFTGYLQRYKVLTEYLPFIQGSCVKVTGY